MEAKSGNIIGGKCRRPGKKPDLIDPVGKECKSLPKAQQDNRGRDDQGGHDCFMKVSIEEEDAKSGNEVMDLDGQQDDHHVNRTSPQ